MHDDARVADLYRNLSMLLEDSTTYQAILKKWQLESAAISKPAINGATS